MIVMSRAARKRARQSAKTTRMVSRRVRWASGSEGAMEDAGRPLFMACKAGR